jgi:carboxymethylenebutenolidase
MTDEDLLLNSPDAQFGAGIIGVCDICGKRQAVITLQKERFKLCVIDFLNKAWLKTTAKPGRPLPPYRSERVWFPSDFAPSGEISAVVLTPTKIVKRPCVLVTPDVYGLTTTVLDAGIRFAREGFEVLLPDLPRGSGVGPRDHLALRAGALGRGGVPVEAPRVRRWVSQYADALAYLRARPMVDPDRSGVFGASYGGSLAVALAAEDHRFGAAVLAYPMPVRPPEFLALLTAPVLFLAGTKDAGARRSRAQFERAAAAGQVAVEVAEFPGARHHFLARDLRRAYRLEAAEAAWARAIAFLRGRLMPSQPKPPAAPRPVSVPPGTPTAVAGAPPGAPRPGTAPVGPTPSTPTAPPPPTPA